MFFPTGVYEYGIQDAQILPHSHLDLAIATVIEAY